MLFIEHGKENRIFREEKEKFLNQKAKVIWFTGLSGAGKTTLALNLEKVLFKRKYLVQVLDGDIIRSGINKNLSFSEDDRWENIRRIAEVSRLFLRSGIITINAFISPTEEIRNLVREIIGADDFIKIFINSPLDVCEKRDVKGLYTKARRGEIKSFTGIDAPFEPPISCDLDVRTDILNVEESVTEILNFILPKIKYKQ